MLALVGPIIRTGVYLVRADLGILNIFRIKILQHSINLVLELPALLIQTSLSSSVGVSLKPFLFPSELGATKDSRFSLDSLSEFLSIRSSEI